MQLLRHIALSILALSAGSLFAQDSESPSKLRMNPSMVQETMYFTESLENIHFKQHPLQDITGKEIIESYLENIDFSKMILTQEQIDAMDERFGPTIHAYLKQGNVYPGFEIFKIYREALNKRGEWIAQRLKEPFELSHPEETFRPDRKDASWESSEESLNALWDRRLRFELINELAQGNSTKNTDEDPLDGQESDSHMEASVEKEEAKPITEAEAIENIGKRYANLVKFYNEIESYEVQELYLNSISRLYDPHTQFLSAQTMEDFTMMMHNSLVGIGAVLSQEDSFCTVREVLPGSPAEACGELKTNDKILAVAQGDEEMVDIVGWRLSKSVKLIRGEIGTVVRLLVEPAGEAGVRKTVTIVRDEIKFTSTLASARFYELPTDDAVTKIGVIELPSFYGPTTPDSKDSTSTQDVRELLEKLKKMGMEGLILDLRRNGGGLLNEAISLTGLFIPIGPVLHSKDANGGLQEHLDTNPEILWDGPMVVLMSRESASAAEIVGGALQAYGRALVVGNTTTHGKGTVQVVVDVPEPFKWPWNEAPKLGAVKVTFRKWYLPNGSSTQLKGVPSDIVVPSILDHLPVGEGDIPYALEWDAIEPLPWTSDDFMLSKKSLVSPTLRARLQAESKARTETLDEYNVLMENIGFVEKRREMKDYPLDIDARKAMDAEQTAFLKDIETQLKALADDQFQYEEVQLELTKHQLAEQAANEAAHPDQQLAGKDEEKEKPEFDIYLRESLRVMRDWLAEREDNEDAVNAPLIEIQEHSPQLADAA